MKRLDPDCFAGERYALLPDVLLAAGGERREAVLIVDAGAVAAIAPADALPAAYSHLEVKRLPGCAIVPGFIDTHHHVIEPFAKAITCGEPAQMWKRIWMPLEATATPELAHLGAKWTFLEALRGGITTIVEHAIRSREMVDGVHRAADETGIRLVSSTGAYDLKNFTSAAATPSAGASVDAALRRAEEHLADCERYPLVTASLACGTVQSASGNMIRALSAFCAAHGILFQIHANEHTQEVHACIEAYGKRPIEYLHALGALGPQTLLAHAVLVTPGEVDMLAETDTAVAYCPVASMWKGNGIAPALEYIRRGLRVGLGSDATRNDGLRMLDASEACQRVRFGMPADDFSCGAGITWVHAATAGGADACRLGKVTGSLMPGERADFLVLNCTSPEVTPSWNFAWELVRYYDRADLLATVVEGKAVVLNGSAVNFDGESFARDALVAGRKWITDTPIVRLHETSTDWRQR
jgi:5-methylthioadenosine/S-adenosylhomocysteine deaminase